MIDDPRPWIETNLYPGADPTKAIHLEVGQQIMLRPPLTRRIVYSHRRSGKTTACALLASWYASLNPKSTTVIFSVGMECIRNIVGLLSFYLDGSVIHKGIYTANRTDLTLTNGSVIEILYPRTNATYTNLRGQDVALLIIDEGELLPDKAWYELTTYMNCRSDMKVFITGTPNNTVDMFSKLCTDPSTGFEQIQYSVLQNPDPKFNQAGLNQIKAGCLPEDWKSQWLAEATVK